MNETLLRAMSAVSSLRARLSEERGQDLIEYAMISGLVALLIAGLTFVVLGDAVGDLMDNIAACITGDDANCFA